MLALIKVPEFRFTYAEVWKQQIPTVGEEEVKLLVNTVQEARLSSSLCNTFGLTVNESLAGL